MKFIVRIFMFPFYLIKIAVMFFLGIILLVGLCFGAMIGATTAKEIDEKTLSWVETMFTYPGYYD